MDLGGWLEESVAAAVLVAPFVLAAVELVKLIWPEMPARFKPLVAIILGEIMAIVAVTQAGGNWREGAVAGFVAGMIAAGVYHYGQSREQAKAARELGPGR